MKRRNQVSGDTLHSRSDSLRSDLSTPPCPRSLMNSGVMTPQRKDSIRASLNSVDAGELAERLDNVLKEKQKQSLPESGIFKIHTRSIHGTSPLMKLDGQKAVPSEIEKGIAHSPTLPQNTSHELPQNSPQSIPEKPPAVRIKRRPSSIVIITNNGKNSAVSDTHLSHLTSPASELVI